MTEKEEFLQKTAMAGKKSDTTFSGSVETLIGRAVEDLSLTERLQYSGTWVAFRIYSPPQKIKIGRASCRERVYVLV